MDEQTKNKLRRLIEETDLGFAEIAKELGMGFQTLKLRMLKSGLKVKRVLVDGSEASR